MGFDLSAKELCSRFGWGEQRIYDLRRRKFKEGNHYVKKEYRRSGKTHKSLRFNIDAILDTLKDDPRFLSASKNKCQKDNLKTLYQQLSSRTGSSIRTIQKIITSDKRSLMYAIAHKQPLPEDMIIESWKGAAIYYYKLADKAQQMIEKKDYSHLMKKEKHSNLLSHFPSDTDILERFARGKKANHPHLEYFTIDEFEDPNVIPDICKHIESDNYNFKIGARKRTIYWLNELLEIPFLYDKIYQSKSIQQLPENIINLDHKTIRSRSKRFNDLKYKEQQYIVRLNRLVLEKIYPKQIPHSLDSRIINLKRLINRLPRELHPTIHTKSKYIIFDIDKLRYLRDEVIVGRGEITKELDMVSTKFLCNLRKRIAKYHKNKPQIPIHVYRKTHYAFKHELIQWYILLYKTQFPLEYEKQKEQLDAMIAVIPSLMDDSTEIFITVHSKSSQL